ncbi:7-carboxy-7-deazaguanine synthase QueE [Anaerobacillus isosaccharinicus]|uniref:7-carboxy-7-deazaguanine synthase n=1 Tax=Anaerobacillus isosaccharinicus TaxID=1532552 RepID=A0A1S2MFH8_9BACI|nr:7-carboxy-7-deazaguanine synthase QueE [Anaerobacillus isosaccharinicus]MBA5584237.1 7-carboxy-7-deazaguanine synthase QueE [Anaerobacillus isosaccharinicus]QOY37361.1 7-carboxy-7-deazaguanine synthase QueE [Anaerobacillus isosaccharinicus]
MKIPVLEIFGPTIQGEGAVIGKKTVFIRTAGCDYQCSWCDSAFTWDGSGKDDIKMMTANEIVTELKAIGLENFQHVTISGGNPALLKQLGELIDILKELNLRIGLETQGTVWQDWMLNIDDLTISPKPPSSGMETNYSKLNEMIEQLTERVTNGHVSLKVVIFDDKDLNYAKKIHTKYSSVPFYLSVGNEDLTMENDVELAQKLLQKLDWLVGKVINDPEFNDARVLPQLHALLWGNKKGV